MIVEAPPAPKGDLDVLVLIGHTKEHIDDRAFEQFLKLVSRDSSLRVISLTELAEQLRACRLAGTQPRSFAAATMHDSLAEKNSNVSAVLEHGLAPAANVPTALLLISDLEFGGAQRQVIELANQMSPQRFDIHVCTLADYVPLADSLRGQRAPSSRHPKTEQV